MNKNGPIVIIEDDRDDVQLFNEIFIELALENEVLYFENGQRALDYLTMSTVKPFLVISDINMPIMSGLELREKIHKNEELRLKCIPFLYFTTSADPRHIINAYSHSIQGYFIKPNNYAIWKNTLIEIIKYWRECVSPPYQSLSSH